jgi:dihydrofolate synthase/folylpolyglutamate synthase
MSSASPLPAPPLPFGSPREVFEYYLRFVNFEESKRRTIREYRLDRMRRLLAFFGNPEQELRTIHLAGSKGKGSTALFLARGLEALGRRTGLYTSPHVSSYQERITLAGRFFPEETYIRAGSKVAAAIPAFSLREEEGSALPTTFELITLTAFLTFVEEECEWAVIETGIGGRLDATNVIIPEASVITPIELEHTELLGNTIEEIAGEKAGIIKEEVPVFLGYQQEEAARRLRTAAREKSAPLQELSGECMELQARLRPEGTEAELHWRDGTEDRFRTPMLGEVQAENAALALLVLRSLLNPAGTAMERMREAFSSCRLAGRMELIATSPPLICDGAHTVSSLRRLLDAMERIYPGRQPVVIFGAVLGKDWEGMAALLAERCRTAVVSTPGNFKQSDPEELHRICRAVGLHSLLRSEPADALREARRIAETEQPVLATGSFYMVAEIRSLVEEHEGLPHTA